MNPIQFIGQFIGPQKIKSLTLANRKTYLGKNVYLVEFTDNDTREYPEEILKKITKLEAGDWNSLRNDSVMAVLEEMQAVLLEAELTLDDINWLAQTKIPLWIEDCISKVYKKFWGKERIWITLQDIDKHLKQNGTTKKQ